MTPEQSTFLATAGPAAQSSMRATGVPASVTIAQAIDESGWGKHAPGNNYFGIKCTAPGQPHQLLDTHEVIHGVEVTVKAAFRAFVDAAECFRAHGLFLSQNPRYRPAFSVKTDAIAFARALQVCGYATDPEYADKLIALIREYDLTRFDSAPIGQAA